MSIFFTMGRGNTRCGHRVRATAQPGLVRADLLIAEFDPPSSARSRAGDAISGTI